MKLLYDKYSPKLKIIATGSSAFYIDKSFKDSLAGRKKVFEFFSLAFDEFLHFRGEDDLITEWIQMTKRLTYKSLHYNRITALFDEYLVYGGYPAVVLAESEQEKEDLLKELVNSYMKKDALEAGVKEGQKFFQLARLLANQTGNLVNSYELAKTLQMASPTIDNYVFLMQKTFIVQILTPFYGNVRKELIKMPKIYFNDNGLRNCLLNNFNKANERLDKGELLENYVCNRLKQLYGRDKLHFWRTADGNEVDFIVEEQFNRGKGYEVKYNSVKYVPNKYKKFLDAYPDFSLSCISMIVGKNECFEAIRL